MTRPTLDVEIMISIPRDLILEEYAHLDNTEMGRIMFEDIKRELADAICDSDVYIGLHRVSDGMMLEQGEVIG